MFTQEGRKIHRPLNRNYEKIELLKFGALRSDLASFPGREKFGLQTENSYELGNKIHLSLLLSRQKLI